MIASWGGRGGIAIGTGSMPCSGGLNTMWREAGSLVADKHEGEGEGAPAVVAAACSPAQRCMTVVIWSSQRSLLQGPDNQGWAQGAQAWMGELSDVLLQPRALHIKLPDASSASSSRLLKCQLLTSTILRTSQNIVFPCNCRPRMVSGFQPVAQHQLLPNSWMSGSGRSSTPMEPDAESGLQHRPQMALGRMSSATWVTGIEI